MGGDFGRWREGGREAIELLETEAGRRGVAKQPARIERQPTGRVAGPLARFAPGAELGPARRRQGPAVADLDPESIEIGVEGGRDAPEVAAERVGRVGRVDGGGLLGRHVEHVDPDGVRIDHQPAALGRQQVGPAAGNQQRLQLAERLTQGVGDRFAMLGGPEQRAGHGAQCALRSRHADDAKECPRFPADGQQ